MNDIGRLFEPDYLFVMDSREKFPGERFRHIAQSRASAVFTDHDLQIGHPNIVRISIRKQERVDFSDGDALHFIGRPISSPYMAIRLAIHMGAKRVGVIGVDFTDHHFFDRAGAHPLTKSLQGLNRRFRELAFAAAAQGIKIFNLSPVSRLSAFPKIGLEDFASLADPPSPPEKVTPRKVAIYSAGRADEAPLWLAQSLNTQTVNFARCVSAGADGEAHDLSWKNSAEDCQAMLRRADTIVVYNGEVRPEHRAWIEGKQGVVMADRADVTAEVPGLSRPTAVGGLVPRDKPLPYPSGWARPPLPVPPAEPARAGEIRIVHAISGPSEERRAAIRGAHVLLDDLERNDAGEDYLAAFAAGCVVIRTKGQAPDWPWLQLASSPAMLPILATSPAGSKKLLARLLKKDSAEWEIRAEYGRRWLQDHWNFAAQWARHWERLVRPHRHHRNGSEPSPGPHGEVGAAAKRAWLAAVAHIGQRDWISVAHEAKAGNALARQHGAGGSNSREDRRWLALGHWLEWFAEECRSNPQKAERLGATAWPLIAADRFCFVGGGMAKFGGPIKVRGKRKMGERWERYLGWMLNEEGGAALADYPGLTARGWREAGEFSFSERIEAAYPAIKREYQSLYGQPGWQEQREGTRRVGEWNVFLLYERGRKNEANCRRCPRTVHLIESIPAVRSHSGLIYFSTLAPATRIGPNRGPTNLRVRCHLPLEAPPPSSLRLGAESRAWMEGRCLFFDDHLEHELRNSSDKLLVMLVIDLWHPESTPADIRALTALQNHVGRQAGGLAAYWRVNEDARHTWGRNGAERP